MVLRRYRVFGERLFRLKDLGSTRAACVDCHAQGDKLSTDLWQRYPRMDPQQGRWISLGSAIDRCLTEEVGALPLRPGSRSQLALQSYLRTLVGPSSLPLTSLERE
jgi:cytochrome c